MSQNYLNIPITGIPKYPSAVDFPMTAGDGTIIEALDTHTLYVYDASLPGWVPIATPGPSIAIDGLIGDVTATGPGIVAATLSNTGVTPGSYTYTALTVDSKGRLTAASNGIIGNLTDVGTDGITITNGANAIIGTGTSISQHVADATHNGYLSSTDWNTFNNLSAGGPYLPLSGGTLTGNLTFSPDNSKSIGLISALRPGTIRVGTDIYVGTATSFDGSGKIYLGGNSTSSTLWSSLYHGGGGTGLVIDASEGATYRGPVSTKGQLFSQGQPDQNPPVVDPGAFNSTIQWNLGNFVKQNLSSLSGTLNQFMVFGNKGAVYYIEVVQGSTAHQINWAANSVQWLSGTAPVFSANTSTLIQFVHDGTSYLGTYDNASFITGNLTDVGTDGIVITNGTGAVVGTGTSIAQHVADSTHNGYLSSTDWSTFNNKLNSNGSSLTGNLLFNPDNTIDIGMKGTFGTNWDKRPRSVLVGTDIYVGTRIIHDSAVGTGNIYLGGRDMDLSGWAVITGGGSPSSITLNSGNSYNANPYGRVKAQGQLFSQAQADQNPPVFDPQLNTVIDWDFGNFVKQDLSLASGNLTQLLLAPQKGAIYYIEVIQGSTARQITWPGNVQWIDASSPIFSSNTTSLIKFIYDGTNYLGTYNNSTTNLANYLPLSGGTMTGAINMSGSNNIVFDTGGIYFDSNTDSILSQPTGALYLNGQYAVELQFNGTTKLEVDLLGVVISNTSASTIVSTNSNNAISSASISSPLVFTSNTLSINQATTSTNGYLSSTDWNTFNNKQPAGSYITTISNTEVSATSNATTTSATDVLLTSMTITPSSGTYLVNFSTSVTFSTGSQAVAFSIYSGGSQKTDSVRTCNPGNAVIIGITFTPGQSVVSTNGVVTVNGSQAIEIRWNTSTGTATSQQRTMNIVKLA